MCERSLIIDRWPLVFQHMDLKQLIKFLEHGIANESQSQKHINYSKLAQVKNISMRHIILELLQHDTPPVLRKKNGQPGIYPNTRFFWYLSSQFFKTASLQNGYVGEKTFVFRVFGYYPGKAQNILWLLINFNSHSSIHFLCKTIILNVQ